MVEEIILHPTVPHFSGERGAERVRCELHFEPELPFLHDTTRTAASQTRRRIVSGLNLFRFSEVNR